MSDAAHMEPMTGLDFSSFLQPAAPLGRQRHRLSWFLVDGTVGFELECLHEPVERPYICDGETFKDDRGIFPECFKGEKTPLRDGVIESWWTGSEEDSEPWWEYTPEQDTTATVSAPAGA